MRLRHISILLVVLLVLANANPCAALTTDGGMPAPSQRELMALPSVAIGGYVVTNAELIALLVGVVGGVVGYVTVAVDKHGVGDIIDHWKEFQEKIPDFFHGGACGLLQFRTHDVHAYKPNTPSFSLVEQRYNTAKVARDSYEDSKRKGIPVPGNQNEPKLAHNTPTMNERPYSSTDIIERVGNRCPKTRRYFDKDGNAEYDIDFSHGQDANGFPSLPHAHKWKWVGDHVERVTGPDGKVLHNWEGMEEVIRNNLGCIRSNGRTPYANMKLYEGMNEL